MDDDRTTKARLRDAAVELVAEGGTKALSARAVADRAGLAYPIRDGVPILLIEEAREFTPDEG